MHTTTPTTIAILGADTVVGRALCLLLEGSGYRPPHSMPTPRGLSTSCSRVHTCCSSSPDWMRACEAFLGAMGKSTPQREDLR